MEDSGDVAFSESYKYYVALTAEDGSSVRFFSLEIVPVHEWAKEIPSLE